MIAINKKLDFSVPVLHMPTPGIISTKSLSTKLVEFADDFFCYGNNKVHAYVTKKTDKNYEVKIMTSKSPIWKTALKIVFLFTPISPILFAIKLISRMNKKFSITDNSALKNRHEFEPLQFKHKQKVFMPAEHYKKMCLNAGIELDKTTPLQKHVLFFANSEGNLTRKSFQKGFERLGSSKITSFLVSYAIFSQLVKHMKLTSNVIPLSQIAKGTHHASTGVFNKDGTLDLNKFEVLKKKYPSIDPNFLTADDLVRMRKANFEKDALKEGAESGSTAAKGEFLFALNLFSDCAVVDSLGKITPAISLDRLKKLYTNGPELFEEVATH